MGSLIEKVLGLFGKKEYRIVMVGLDGVISLVACAVSLLFYSCW
jgi:hypothetical protein